MAKKNQYQNLKAHFFNPTTNTLHVEQVTDVIADQIETESGVYSIDEAKRYYDEANGNIVYVYHVDLPAKLEASNLKKLRRSNALHRIFEYDVKTPTDIMKFVPYLIIIMLIVFK